MPYYQVVNGRGLKTKSGYGKGLPRDKRRQLKAHKPVELSQQELNYLNERTLKKVKAKSLEEKTTQPDKANNADQNTGAKENK